MARPREWTDAKIEALADDLWEWYNEDETRLFYASWLAKRGLHTEHKARFQRVNDKFRDVCKKIDAMQEERLCQAGIGAGKNPGMAIFVLKNKHGYADKVEQRIESTSHQVVSVDASSLSAEELRQKIFEMTERAKRN